MPTISPAARFNVLLVAAAGLAGIVTWLFITGIRRIDRLAGDFGHFWHAGKAMVAGDDIYSSYTHNYIYPPLTAFLYAPLTVFDAPTAMIIVLMINLALVVATAWLSAALVLRMFDFPHDAAATAVTALAAAALTVDKLKGEIQHWQTNLAVLFCFTLALAWVNRRPFLAGFPLGFAFNIKYQTVALVPWMLLRCRWRLLGGWVAGSVLFALLPAVLSGWETNLTDLATAFRGLGRTVGAVEGGGENTANVPTIDAGMSVSITSAVARGVPRSRSMAPTMIVTGSIAAAVLVAVLGMYFVRGVPFWRRTGPPESRRERALTLIEWIGLLGATLLFSPQTNTRHLSLLMLPHAAAAALLIFSTRIGSRIVVLFGVLTVGLGIHLPPPGEEWASVTRTWWTNGGPAWCVLVLILTLTWAGLGRARELEEPPGKPAGT